MTEFVFPLPTPSVAIKGTAARFPVRRIWCVGRNYAAHAREMGADTREPPFFFSKQPDMITGAREVPYPGLTTDLQHESNWWWRSNPAAPASRPKRRWRMYSAMPSAWT